MHAEMNWLVQSPTLWGWDTKWCQSLIPIQTPHYTDLCWSLQDAFLPELLLIRQKRLGQMIGDHLSVFSMNTKVVKGWQSQSHTKLNMWPWTNSFHLVIMKIYIITRWKRRLINCTGVGICGFRKALVITVNRTATHIFLSYICYFKKAGFLHKYHLKWTHEIITLCLVFGLNSSLLIKHGALSPHNVRTLPFHPDAWTMTEKYCY